MSDLGMAIRSARKNAGLSQQAVADSLSVPQSSISTWESGAVVPTVPLLLSLAETVNIDPAALLQIALDSPRASA